MLQDDWKQQWRLGELGELDFGLDDVGWKVHWMPEFSSFDHDQAIKHLPNASNKLE